MQIRALINNYPNQKSMKGIGMSVFGVMRDNRRLLQLFRGCLGAIKIVPVW